jgi:hypothetical protein
MARHGSALYWYCTVVYASPQWLRFGFDPFGKFCVYDSTAVTLLEEEEELE